jgi:hypothetical protein
MLYYTTHHPFIYLSPRTHAYDACATKALLAVIVVYQWHQPLVTKGTW